MIELLFVTCLQANMEHCRTRSVLFTDDVGLMTCMIHAQTHLARWAEDHPQESVSHWKCRYLNLAEKRL